MIRAVFFDFYSVWSPDRFSEYLEIAQQHDPEVARELDEVIQNYYLGIVDAVYVADSIRLKLNRPDIEPNEFILRESDISPKVVEFMRGLHGHFLKLGILANLGKQEYDLLTSFNTHNQLFEAITGPLPQGVPLPLLSQEVFVTALQAIGEPPQSCLVVTGNKAYIRFAENLGIRSLKFEGFPKLQQSLDQLLAGST